MKDSPECRMDFFSLSLHLGRKLAQGFLAAEGGAFGLGLQSCLAARGFLVFIKILGLSFQIAPLAMAGL